jgi:hypothetical protein
MKNTINKTPRFHTKFVNGVFYEACGGKKWSFKGETSGGVTFEKIDVVHGAVNAEKVARAIGSGLKRCATGIDGLAKAEIRRILAPSENHFKGINFHQHGDVYN